MENRIEQIKAEALESVAESADIEQIKSLSVKYLGRKGLVTLFLRNISQLPVNERPEAGKQANITKKKLESAFEKAIADFEAKTKDDGFNAIDVSLPGRPSSQGTLHPITHITRHICSIFSRMGRRRRNCSARQAIIAHRASTSGMVGSCAVHLRMSFGYPLIAGEHSRFKPTTIGKARFNERTGSRLDRYQTYPFALVRTFVGLCPVVGWGIEALPFKSGRSLILRRRVGLTQE